MQKQQRLFAFVALQFARHREERTVEGSAIIIGEFNQTGFYDEAAQFDQM